MPAMPPRPCTSPNCKAMASKAGKCSDHYVKPEAWKSSKGKTAAQRGYGHKWQGLRLSVLKRDNYMCQHCLISDIVTHATEVDHIVNKASGGDDSYENLQAICTKCHRVKTVKERQQGKH